MSACPLPKPPRRHHRPSRVSRLGKGLAHVLGALGGFAVQLVLLGVALALLALVALGVLVVLADLTVGDLIQTFMEPR